MKKIIALLLTMLMFLSLTPTALAAEDEAAAAAEKLHALGLFNGIGTDEAGNPIFALDRAPTRHEAVTMLVRLLGKETEALAGKWETPFTDVAEWAKPYVGYAYANGLTNGISPTAFGGENTVSAAQYLTFVLRALGYKSGVDFVWERAWELTDRLGITNGEYNEENDTFVRGDIAIISADALDQPLKGEEITLAEHIQAEQAKAENSSAAPIVSEPGSAYSSTRVWYIDGTPISGGSYVSEAESHRITLEVKGIAVKEIKRVIVSDPSVCTAWVEQNEVVLTKIKDGKINLQVYYIQPAEPAETTSAAPDTAAPSQESAPQTAPDTSKPYFPDVVRPVRESRTDLIVRFGPLPKVPGISLERNDTIIQNGNGFGTSGQTIFVPTVLFDGEPVSDYTVTSDDSGTKFTVQADGTLLIEKPSTGTVSFTITCRGQTASFRVTS